MGKPGFPTTNRLEARMKRFFYSVATVALTLITGQAAFAQATPITVTDVIAPGDVAAGYNTSYITMATAVVGILVGIALFWLLLRKLGVGRK